MLKMKASMHTVFAVIATVIPYLVQAGTDCFTGAVFHGGGFVMNNSIANLDEFTLESWGKYDFLFASHITRGLWY